MSIPFDLIGASLALCLRLLLGGVFLFGGIVKLKDHRAFEGVLRSLVGTGWPRPFLSRALPLLEAMLGILLVFNVATMFVTWCMLLLLVVFSTILLYGWKTHTLKECGCTRTPLSPQTALVRNGLLLPLGGMVLWHPDPSFSSWSLLIEGAVALFLMLVAIRGSRSTSQEHQRLSPGSGPSRRSLLRRGLALATALALPFTSPIASLAQICVCSCPGQGYFSWGECICDIRELYYVEVTLCCGTPYVCDLWYLGAGFIECNV